MYQLQETMRENNSMDKIAVSTMISSAISPKFKLTPDYPVIKCAACKLSCVIIFFNVIKQAIVLEKQAIMSWDKYEVRYFISEDQFIDKTSGHFSKWIRM